MPDSAWLPPPSERAIGLGFYASSTPPVAGRLKADAADFVVEELSSYPSPVADGAFTILRLRSRDWEQHELAQEVARRLGLAPHSIRWAGTKDRRAVSDRLFSYRGPPPSGPLGLPGVEVVEAYAARDGLQLGHHYGNRFTVRISELDGPGSEHQERFVETRRELAERGGFPNFYGGQRFGEVRPVTHLVGRALVLGDPAAAVETYLSFVDPASPSLGDGARRQYAADHDAQRALRAFPPTFRFERTLLDHLARGHSPERALRALSLELRKLFVHAYQSFLFNCWLSDCWEKGRSFDRPEPGDHLLRYGPDGTLRSDSVIPVSADNLPEGRELAARGRAVLAGPIVGYESSPGEGIGGETLATLLASEGIGPRDFRLPRTPEISSAGGWRAARVPMPPIDLAVPRAPDPSLERAIECRFTLGKGSYATVLLREFLKSGATPICAPSNCFGN